MQKTNKLHNPIHIFMDDTSYFITATIYQKSPLLRSSQLKELLLNYINLAFKRYQWELHHWVILDNHYHLLGRSREGKHLSEIMRQIHSISGYYIKQATQTKQRIWWNYWDYCPRNEKDYLIRLNYLFNNPIKHGYVQNLRDYPFSSFHSMLEKQGRELLQKQFKGYNDYKNLILDEDDF